MARMTATDFVQMVRDSVGGETSETLSDTRVLRFVNQAYNEVCSKYRFPQLEATEALTTSSGTAEYEVANSDYLNIITLVDDTNNYQMYPISKWQYDRYTQGQASSITGNPVYWFISGVGSNSRYQITMYPTPDGTYTVNVYYHKKPSELVTSPNATSAIIPEPWDDVIYHKAVQRAWRQLGDMDKAWKWQQATKEIEQAAYKSSYEPSWIPVRIGSRVGRACR